MSDQSVSEAQRKGREFFSLFSFTVCFFLLLSIFFPRSLLLCKRVVVLFMERRTPAAAAMSSAEPKKLWALTLPDSSYCAKDRRVAVSPCRLSERLCCGGPLCMRTTEDMASGECEEIDRKSEPRGVRSETKISPTAPHSSHTTTQDAIETTHPLY